MPYRDDDFGDLDPYEDPDSVYDADGLDLQRCSSCNAWIYDDAEQCPSCGEYISLESDSASKPWWVVLAAVILLIVIIVYWI